MPQLLEDPKKASLILDSVGNDIIVDSSPKRLGWWQKREYYAEEALINDNIINNIGDMVSLIETRTSIVQAKLENFFFTDKI